MCFPSVVCDRLITNGSGSGDPDLQSLASEQWRGTGPRPTVKESVFYRSDRWVGEGERFFSVARGPVPRERCRPDVCFLSVGWDRLITNGSGSGDPDLQSLARGHWRGTGPRPTVKENVFYRSDRWVSEGERFFSP